MAAITATATADGMAMLLVGPSVGRVAQDWLVGLFATEGALCYSGRADGGEQRNGNS